MSKIHNVEIDCPDCAARLPEDSKIVAPIPDDHPSMIAGVPATAELAVSMGHEGKYHPQDLSDRLLKTDYQPSLVSTRITNFDHGKDHN